MLIWGGNMQISEIFKQTISDIFYDKYIEIWTSETIKDEEGSIIESGKKDLVETIKGNFQFKTREYIQKEYGQEIEANAIVTCDKTVAKIGNILVYNAREYEIKSVIPSDSHITLLVNGSDIDG